MVGALHPGRASVTLGPSDGRLRVSVGLDSPDGTELSPDEEDRLPDLLKELVGPLAHEVTGVNPFPWTVQRLDLKRPLATSSARN